jgi:hypothetical protein
VPIDTGIGTALLMALAHTVLMIARGLTLAWAVYRWLGPTFIRRGWLNLESVWALSLVATGAVTAGLASVAPHG